MIQEDHISTRPTSFSQQELHNFQNLIETCSVRFATSAGQEAPYCWFKVFSQYAADSHRTLTLIQLSPGIVSSAMFQGLGHCCSYRTSQDLGAFHASWKSFLVPRSWTSWAGTRGAHLVLSVIVVGCSVQVLKNRPDLKLVVMSATLEAEKFQGYFLDAPLMKVSHTLQSDCCCLSLFNIQAGAV